MIKNSYTITRKDAEYRKLIEAKQDRDDYPSAIKVKETNKKWTSHKDLKKTLDM